MNKALCSIGLTICVILCVNTVFASDGAASDNATISSVVVKEDYSLQLIEKIRVERNSIYNVLNLTPDQIKKKNELEEKRYSELRPKLKQFCLDRKALKDLETEKKTDTKTIKSAQNKLDITKNDIRKTSLKFDKEFKKILNHEQKSKYNMIVKLKRAEMQELKHKQKETLLRPFGVPVSQAEYTQQQKEKHSLKNLFKCDKK